MGRFTISITKRCAFRDATQEFSNTYTYGNIGQNPSEETALQLIDFVVEKEKLFHSTAVSFIYARCWSTGGTIEENQMIAEKVLTGTGSAATLATLDRERAVLVQWPAGNDSKGRPVYLRKWYHPCGLFGSAGSWPTSVMEQLTGMTQSQRDLIVGLVDPLTRIPGLQTYGLMAESGRERSGGLLAADPPVAHKYLEHHQFGDQWRG